MPPKGFKPLALAVPQDDEQQMHSLKMNPSGTITVLTASYNPYSFSSGGLVKSNQHGHQNYKISEEDIYTLRTLGHGASGTVCKGFLFQENKFVAIKKINIFEKEKRHQMMNDIKALCEAPNAPGLIEFFGAYHASESGQVCIVLEYMDGGSLGDVLSKVGKIPENILSKITAKVLAGLSCLHRNMHTVHRDIKPANILMNLEGESKITDFGISAFVNSTMAVCHTFLGTVTYMSPERIHNKPYSFPADIWSLGLALVECATGEYPYDASVGPLQLMIQVCEDDLPLPPAGEYSDELRDFVRQCLQKEPFLRPSADQLLTHPFITKYANDPADLKTFMQCAFDPHDKLDEIAIVFAWNYYALMSAGVERLGEIAPLYAETSELSHEGEVAVGRAAIMARLRVVANMYAAFGRVVYTPRTVDCQPLGLDGSALVHVQGVIYPRDVAGASESPSYFTETFILGQLPSGEYYVANQAFRMLK